jgi:hypothetical protein
MDQRPGFKAYALVAALTLLVLVTSPVLVAMATVLYVATLAAFIAALLTESSRAVRAWSRGHGADADE